MYWKQKFVHPISHLFALRWPVTQFYRSSVWQCRCYINSYILLNSSPFWQSDSSLEFHSAVARFPFHRFCISSFFLSSLSSLLIVTKSSSFCSLLFSFISNVSWRRISCRDSTGTTFLFIFCKVRLAYSILFISKCFSNQLLTTRGVIKLLHKVYTVRLYQNR